MTWIQLLIDFLAASSVLLIGAFGLYLTFGLYRVVNMAHGEFVLLGAYIAALTQAAGYPFLLSVISAGLTVGVVALILDRALIGKLRLTSSLSPLLATWGVGVVISQTIRLVLGPAGVAVNDPVNCSIDLFGTTYSGYQLSLICVAFILSFVLWYTMHRLQIGLFIRAQAGDEALAELNGINTRRLFSSVFFAGGVLAGVAGALLAPLASINPASGPGFSISAFMVVIVGGMDHMLGQVFGAAIVGGGRSLISIFSNVTIATLGTLIIVAIILAVRQKDDVID